MPIKAQSRRDGAGQDLPAKTQPSAHARATEPVTKTVERQADVGMDELIMILVLRETADQIAELAVALQVPAPMVISEALRRLKEEVDRCR